MKLTQKNLLYVVSLISLLTFGACSSDNDEVLSSEAVLNSFALGEYEAVITGNTVELSIPKSEDIKASKPVVKVSAKATTEPDFSREEPIDLSNLRTIKVVSQDQETHSEYAFRLKFFSSDTYINTFSIADPEVKGEIDSEKHIIKLTFPSDFDSETITPTIVVANTSTVTPKSEEEVKLEGLTYKVVAEDGTEQTYTVEYKIEKAATSGYITMDELQGSWRVDDFKIIALCQPKELVDPMSEYFTTVTKRRSSDSDDIMRSTVRINGNHINVKTMMRKGEQGTFEIEENFLVSSTQALGFNGRMKVEKLPDGKLSLNVGSAIIEPMSYMGNFYTYFRTNKIEQPGDFKEGKIMVVLTLKK